MDKIRLSRQLIVIFTIVIIFSMLVFIILTNQSLSSIYETVNINRLNQFVESTESAWNQGEETKTQGIDYIIYDSSNNQFYFSEAVHGLDNIDAFNLINGEEKNKTINKIEYIDDNKIYFSIRISDNGNYIIAMSDESYISGLKNIAMQQMIIIFGAILVIGNMVIAVWSRGLVIRLHSIQKDVINLPKNNYSKEIPPYGDDEIGDLANSIEEMRKEIEKNEKTKQEMLQNVSHDIKTPVAVIKSYAEAILDGIETKDGAEVIIKQSEILKKKAKQLLEFNKLEYLDKNREFELVNMKDVVLNVLENYRFQTNIEFKTDLQDVYFKGFLENYFIVVDNIVDNGIRYAKSKIEIILRENELIISNDGPKIDEEFINDIYKPYEKSHKGQFGLGMSIVQRTLTFFNMSIEIKNSDKCVSFIIKKE